VCPPFPFGKAPDEAARGSFVIPIIFPDHHGHGLELSGPCQSNKSEFPLNQYPQLAPSQLPGYAWNNGSFAVPSITGPDPEWWTDNIITESFHSEVYQDHRSALVSVSHETPWAFGTESISAVFEPAFQPSGFCQPTFDFDDPDFWAIDFEQEALQADPGTENCIVFDNPTSPIHMDWDSPTSSSTLRSDCDSSSPNSVALTPPKNEAFCPGSHLHRKYQISVLRPHKCPQ
jgi:hypothetical protein